MLFVKRLTVFVNISTAIISLVVGVGCANQHLDCLVCFVAFASTLTIGILVWLKG
jgi:hypothetical protein